MTDVMALCDGGSAWGSRGLRDREVSRPTSRVLVCATEERFYKSV